jgi:hypothetical protein
MITIREIHPKDAWFPFRDQIVNRTAIVHDEKGGITDEFKMLNITFVPPLSVNGARMHDKMWLRCKSDV